MAYANQIFHGKNSKVVYNDVQIRNVISWSLDVRQEFYESTPLYQSSGDDSDKFNWRQNLPSFASWSATVEAYVHKYDAESDIFCPEDDHWNLTSDISDRAWATGSLYLALYNTQAEADGYFYGLAHLAGYSQSVNSTGVEVCTYSFEGTNKLVLKYS